MKRMLGNKKEIVKLLKGKTVPITLKDLVEELEINEATLYARIRMLVTAGVIETVYEERIKPGRPKVLFKLTDNYLENLDDNFLLVEAF